MPSSSTELREKLSCMRVIDVIDPQACDPHIIVSELVGIVLSRTNIITLQSSTDDLIQLFHSNTQVKFPVLGDTFWDFWKAVLKRRILLLSNLTGQTVLTVLTVLSWNVKWQLHVLNPHMSYTGGRMAEWFRPKHWISMRSLPVKSRSVH